MWRSMWGCALAVWMPAAWARCRRRRVAACRSIRAPRVFSRIGPQVRKPIARSMARPTRWWQRDQHHLGALAAYSQHPVAVLLAEVGDVRAGGFEDPQAEQPEHSHQREAEQVRRFPRGGEQRLELQLSKPQRRRFRWDGAPANVLRG